MVNRRRITVALVALLLLVLGGWLVKHELSGGSSSTPPSSPAAQTSGAKPAGADSGLKVQALSSLPPEAAQTWKLIQAGGPFPHPRNDGVVFNNAEKHLPRKASGYYHEYTVDTPGSSDRGTRRLIYGQGKELYYTGDHYNSFVVVDTGR